MAGQDIWWSYWYFHLPNYALAVLFYTLWGRFLLSFILAPESPNYIWRWFRRLTGWILGPVDFITPAILPRFLLPPIAAFWVAILRVAFFMAMYSAGLTPRIAPAS
jgi:YggT family protein